MTKDRAFSLSMFIFGITMLSATFQIAPKNTFQDYSSAFYPRILIIILLVMSVMLFFATFFKQQTKITFNIKKIFKRYYKIILIFLLFLFFVFFMSKIGFILSAITFIFLSQLLLMESYKIKSIFISFFISVVTSLIINYIFVDILLIFLP